MQSSAEVEPSNVPSVESRAFLGELISLFCPAHASADPQEAFVIS
jgi:hypothetical protein